MKRLFEGVLELKKNILKISKTSFYYMLFFLLFTSACSKKDNITDSASYNKYSVEEIPLHQEYIDDTKTFLSPMGYNTENSYYLLEKSKHDSNGNIIYETQMIKGNPYDRDSSISEEDLYFDYGSRGYIISEDLFCVFSTFWDDISNSMVHNIILCNFDNCLLKEKRLEEIYCLQNNINYEQENYRISCSDVQFDDSYIYIDFFKNSETREVYVLDYDLNVVDTLSAKEYFKLIPNANNRCLIMKDGKEIYKVGEDGLKKMDYDMSLFKIFNPERMDIYPGNDNYDFFFLMDSNAELKDEYDNYKDNLIGVKDGKGEALFSRSALGLRTDGNPKNVMCGEDGTFFIIDLNVYKGYEEKYYLLRPSDKSEGFLDRKTKIVIAGLFESPSIRKAISAYNCDSEEYYIEFINYNESEDYYSNKERFLVELATQGDFDAIILTGLSRRDLIQKDLLYDLNDYFNKSENVSEDDFVPFVFRNMRDSEDKIYSIYPEISFEGVISKEEIDFQSLEKYKNDLDHKMFIDSDYAFTPTEMLSLLIRYSGNKYIDQDNHELHFDKEFEELLEILKKQSDNTKNYNFSQGAASKLTKDETSSIYVLMEFPFSYFFNKEITQNTLKCTSISNSGLIMVPSSSEISVLSYSAHKEGVYDFFDYIFEKDNYHNLFSKMAFPVTKAAWNEWEVRMMAEEDYYNEYDELIHANGFYYEEGGVKTTLSVVSNVEIEEMNDTLSSSRYVEPIDDKYLAIIEEESEEYFEGKKNSKETIDAINSRLIIAINE